MGDDDFTRSGEQVSFSGKNQNAQQQAYKGPCDSSLHE
jgi:hypothetical protein